MTTEKFNSNSYARKTKIYHLQDIIFRNYLSVGLKSIPEIKI